MTLLTKAAVLAAADLPHEDVACPEWGGSIRVRALTAAERDKLESETYTSDDEGRKVVNMVNIRARLVARSAIDADGQRLFDDADIEALGRKNAATLDRLFDVCQRLSGMSKRDVEELEKN